MHLGCAFFSLLHTWDVKIPPTQIQTLEMGICLLLPPLSAPAVGPLCRTSGFSVWSNYVLCFKRPSPLPKLLWLGRIAELNKNYKLYGNIPVLPSTIRLLKNKQTFFAQVWASAVLYGHSKAAWLFAFWKWIVNKKASWAMNHLSWPGELAFWLLIGLKQRPECLKHRGCQAVLCNHCPLVLIEMSLFPS